LRHALYPRCQARRPCVLVCGGGGRAA
jgi:hypothetical protein